MIIKRNEPDSGPLTLDRLADFEKQLGFRLPDDYRNFMIKHNGGIPEPPFFWAPGSTESDWVNLFLAIDDQLAQPSRDARFNSIAGSLMGTKYFRPDDALPIALVSDDNILFLRFSGSRRGCVDLKVLLESDLFEVDMDKQDPESGMQPIADSFNEFLSRLQDDVSND